MLRSGLACVRQLQARWLGNRSRTVLLVVGDDPTMARETRESAARWRDWRRPTTVVGGVHSAVAGFHSGTLFSEADEDARRAGYSEVLAAAVGDHLLLAEADFIVAVAEQASSYARAACERAGKAATCLRVPPRPDGQGRTCGNRYGAGWVTG
jgi:hypothetical protein